jgi:hypothetical protein
MMGVHMARMKKETEESPTRVNRISIPLNGAGGIDWDGMRGSTRSRLLDMTPDIADRWQQETGVISNDGDGGAVSVGLTEANVHECLDLISRANGLLFRIGVARFVKHPLKVFPDGSHPPLVLDPDIVDQTFRLTDAQHKELDPRAYRIAQKKLGDMPEWIKKNFDLYVLGLMFLKYTADNAQTAIKAQLTRDVQTAIQNQAAPQTPPPGDAIPRQPINGHAVSGMAGVEPPSNAQPGSSFDAEPEESLEPGNAPGHDDDGFTQ